MPIPSVITSRFRFAGDLSRAADVAGVLAKYGLATWLNNVEWQPLVDALRSVHGEALTQQPFPARVRLALTDLGTTFIKLGQMLSTRPDLVGQEMAAELTKLQERAPVDPPDVAQKVVESELGRPIDECYRKFDGVALASASVGQAHRARLKNGRKAIVKVQHPGIEGVVRRDLDILRFLAELAEKSEQLRQYQPVSLIREFSRTTLNELDFRRELRNLQAFRRNFAEDETVVFPRPYPELTSGRTLTMEFIKGFSVTDSRHLEKLPVPPAELARRGANVFIQMIFRDGFYHADPHPGNFLVMPDGKICLLDAGMVGRIDSVLLTQIEDILLAAGDQDAERLTEAMTRVCGAPRDLDRASLSADLSEFFGEFGTQDVGKFDVSGALMAVTEILHEHKLVLPGKLSMLLKCLMLLEGTGRLLSPTFSLAELLAPWRKKLIMRRLSPEARFKSMRRLYADWERIAEGLPKFAATMMDRLDKGEFIFRLEHKHLKSAANRLVTGLLLSTFLLCSTLFIIKGVGAIRGYSVPGIFGYAVTVAFGLRMIWINRDRRVSKREGDWD
jgi:ubiquinone biosynthesis protein